PGGGLGGECRGHARALPVGANGGADGITFAVARPESKMGREKSSRRRRPRRAGAPAYGFLLQSMWGAKIVGPIRCSLCFPVSPLPVGLITQVRRAFT